MPSVKNTMAAGVVPRRSSSTARTPSPSRVDWPVGAAERSSVHDAGHVRLPARPHAGEKIDPQLVAVGDAAEQGAFVLGQQRSSQVPAAQLDVSAPRDQPLDHRLPRLVA